MANDHIADDRKKVRLIDANALMDSFCQACSTNKRYKMTDAECRSKRDSYGNGCFKMRLIENAPTVDAVEGVRCKDCKYYDNSEGIQWCHLNSKFFRGGFDWHSFPEDGFCCFGERKAGNEK